MFRIDQNCLTLPNGDCIAEGPCMHSIREELSEDEVIVYDDLIKYHDKAIRDSLAESER